MQLEQRMINWMENQINGFTNHCVEKKFGDDPKWKKVYTKLKRRGSRRGFMVYSKPLWFVL